MSRTHSRKHWSETETAKALSLRAKGRTYQQIADALGRTLPAVAFRFRLVMYNDPEPMPDTPRHCLRCKVEFMAFGRFNRLCGVCSETAKFLSSSLAS